ncbi:MAG: response regulator [Anaerolineae bacterium]|nr:response regulator [Anaerolineae bacterium]
MSKEQDILSQSRPESDGTSEDKPQQPVENPKQTPELTAPPKPATTPEPAVPDPAGSSAPAVKTSEPVAPPKPAVQSTPAAPPGPAVKTPEPAAPSKPAAQPVTAAVEEKQPPDKSKAIVVDDEPANRDFLVRLLEQANMEVEGASSGEQALAIVRKHKQISLIVIDNKLPDMDGVDLLAQLHKQFPDARLVMATMLDDRQLIGKAFENGCDVFLVKPHGFMELFQRLQLSDKDKNKLTGLIIDQYGPRPYRG